MATFLPVLALHALDNEPSAISFSPEAFQRGVGTLYENDRKTIGLLEAFIHLSQAIPFLERVCCDHFQ